MSNTIAIIGGGASGMIAAYTAIKAGVKVILLEKNEKLGKKLYITGKGRCNITNDCEINTFLENVPRNAKFLFSALNYLSPSALRNLLETLNCPTKLERGRRVYPVSDKASDVTRAIERAIESAEIRLNSKVSELDIVNNNVKGLRLADGEYLPCKAIVVATGGLSYPVTGSTGDGYMFAKQAGLEVTSTSPALVPINLSDDWVKELSGLTLKNVLLTASIDGKEVFSKQGELLFTHFGISGPIAISLSSHITGIEAAKIDINLNMKPALDTQTLMNRLKRECEESGSTQLNTLMRSYVPKNMVDIVLDISGLNAKTKLAHLGIKDRLSIVNALKNIPLHFEDLRPFNEAVITRGGISVDEIDPSTMKAKTISGLYFAGEVLDVDAYTGGYNLQIAFSTGALAGKSAAEFVRGKE